MKLIGTCRPNFGVVTPVFDTAGNPCSTRCRPHRWWRAGNVETSAWITNALYGALGVMASGQCTMNNFTFGNERYQYYETISGGSGAGPGFDGTSVVQTHMTNSRLTDPEVLELRFPVRLDSIRRVRFLEPLTAHSDVFAIDTPGGGGYGALKTN